MTDTKQPTGRTERDGTCNPSLWQMIVRSRSKEFLERKRRVEDGPYHPTEELLKEYVLHQLDESDAEIIMDHLSLCGPCAREALRLRWKLQDQTGSLWTKIRDFGSSLLSLPAFLYAPALEPVKGATEDREQSYRPGMLLFISMEAPSEGYVTVFRGCEYTDEVEIFFPHDITNDSQVVSSQELKTISATVRPPLGKHWFTIFWTRRPVLDFHQVSVTGEEQKEEALKEFWQALSTLDEGESRATTLDYEVVSE